MTRLHGPTLLLLLLCLCMLICAGQAGKALAKKKVKTLVYKEMIESGLISQFLQVKRMHYMANKFGRNLGVARFQSEEHYGKAKFTLCDTFKMPEDVYCVDSSLPDCKDKVITEEELRSNDQTVYYCAKFMKMGARTNREALAKAVDINFKLEFVPQKQQLIHEFKSLLLGSNYNSSSSSSASRNYTVVHWRRGDQLVTRCPKLRDMSVNCKSASELIKKVREYSQDKLVYVATNEPIISTAAHLLRNAGFLMFDDVWGKHPSVSSSNSNNSSQLDILSIFAMEIGLMMDASTFLAWGLSEVNDVVENERRMLGKSYCLGQDWSEIPNHNYMTWCAFHFNATINSTISTKFTGQKTRIFPKSFTPIHISEVMEYVPTSEWDIMKNTTKYDFRGQLLKRYALPPAVLRALNISVAENSGKEGVEKHAMLGNTYRLPAMTATLHASKVVHTNPIVETESEAAQQHYQRYKLALETKQLEMTHEISPFLLLILLFGLLTVACVIQYAGVWLSKIWAFLGGKHFKQDSGVKTV